MGVPMRAPGSLAPWANGLSTAVSPASSPNEASATPVRAGKISTVTNAVRTTTVETIRRRLRSTGRDERRRTAMWRSLDGRWYMWTGVLGIGSDVTQRG
jgi:hypothetical protein